MNVKPGSGYTAQDHSLLTSAPGTQDCSACHSWPGTGGGSAPNWKGGGNMPQFIAVGGFAIPNPPATTATTQTGIANLPHPTLAAGMACTSCHAGGVGGKRAIGYDHASALINAACSACHEAGSNLVGTSWNGATTQASGAGDTRPTTITSLKATRGSGGGGCTLTNAAAVAHFYPVQCGQCHNVPPGTGPATTGTAYTSAWTFPHTTSKMTNPATCNLCHSGTGCSK
jgi:cytochrome c551/c552